MKHQYFGDIRDLFKYDLIETILCSDGLPNKCTFIAMLTKDDTSSDGHKTDHRTARAGYRNLPLKSFLEENLRSGSRNLYQLEKYCKCSGIEIVFAARGVYLSKDNRNEYFDVAVSDILPRSLIFLDPDTGLEVKNSNERHLLFGEVARVYNYMDKDSVLMIYQHYPREDHTNYELERAKELFKALGVAACSLSDGEVLFFLLAKTPEKDSLLAKTLERYSLKYPQISFREYGLNI